jgi:phage repressor protein C with HTH and peptisase S24 domain
MAFKDRLKLITGDFDSLRSLASKLNVSESAVRKWLKGETEPALGNLVTLANLGGVNVEWLATGEGAMRRGEKTRVEAPSLKEKLDRLEKRGAAAPALDLAEPELRRIIGGLAGRYGVEERLLARIIDDLGAVGVGDDFAMVPRFDVTASAGPGAVTERDRVIDHLAFRLDWIKSELRLPLGGLVVIRARGDSMAPTIGEGDVLLVDGGQERLSDGGIFVILRGEDLVVKRIQTTGEGYLLVSDNPRYRPEPIRAGEEEGPRVIGRVVWIGHRL